VVRLELRYVKRQARERRRADGTTWRREYRYYRRPGAPDDGARLPGSPTDPGFMEALNRFNAQAEEVPPERVRGTFARLAAEYRASPEFTQLAEKTCRDYANLLGKLTAMLGPFPASEIDREAVYAIRDKFRDRPHLANYVLRVLRLLLAWAVDRGQLAVNPAAHPKQLRVRPRRQVWSQEAESRFLEVASAPMRLAYMLQAYTAQRQADILAMTWGQLQDGVIRLRQAKTDALVEVPVHSALRTALQNAPRVSTHILTDHRGRPFKGDNFRHQWRAATVAAGLDGLQNRDLRRTAMVRMAEAGATDIQIAAVSGHTIEDTRRILETYLPRTTGMAQAAVRKLEAHTRRKRTE
jgi:integrase